MYCKHCGKSIAEDSEFCQYCGCRVEPENDQDSEKALKERKDSQEEIEEFVDQAEPDMALQYEEVISLLRKLHQEIPALEERIESLKLEFFFAQEKHDKMETSLTSSFEKMSKFKQAMLSEFEAECREVIQRLISDAQSQVTAMIKRIEEEKKNEAVVVSETELSQLQPEKPKKKGTKSSTKKQKEKMVEGESYTGVELLEKFSAHIDKDLFVKRKGPKTGFPWSNDYCMLVTEISDGKVYGEIYKGGILYDPKKEYSVNDSYVIYRGPSEEKILASRG